MLQLSKSIILATIKFKEHFKRSHCQPFFGRRSETNLVDQKQSHIQMIKISLIKGNYGSTLKNPYYSVGEIGVFHYIALYSVACMNR